MNKKLVIITITVVSLAIIIVAVFNGADTKQKYFPLKNYEHIVTKKMDLEEIKAAGEVRNVGRRFNTFTEDYGFSDLQKKYLDQAVETFDILVTPPKVGNRAGYFHTTITYYPIIELNYEIANNLAKYLSPINAEILGTEDMYAYYPYEQINSAIEEFNRVYKNELDNAKPRTIEFSGELITNRKGVYVLSDGDLKDLFKIIVGDIANLKS